MKTLNLHCDYIKFEALKKALKTVDDIAPNQNMSGDVGECLVVLMAVEQGDSQSSVSGVVSSVRDIASQVKADTVVLYPYAHLSSNLGSPKLAVEVMDAVATELSDFNLVRAPFGYYKSFELKVKGHPLSELSREFSGSDESSEHVDSLSDAERSQLWKKLSKVKMSAPRGKDDLKSNVELGRELDLYIVSDVIGQGLPLLTPKGASIKRELERFIVDEELKRGYEHTSTPVMAKSDLYKLSGHWCHYKDDMFTLKVKNEDFALRPMTCPFHFTLFKRKPRSYKDLPKRYAEVASLFRNEQSGELRGLTRLRQFTLADAHIICAPDQLESEFGEVLNLLKFVMETLGVDVWYRFSKWDPKNVRGKYIDDPKAWEETQATMKSILDKLGVEYVEADDEAAFYGPKLDLQYRDVYGKEDTLITIQIDFANCHNFDLKFLDRDGSEKHAMVIHRSSTGATERVMSYLLEKNQGALPLWLSPVQVKVLSMGDDVSQYARSVCERLRSEGIRCEVDVSSESVGKKVRSAISSKVFYLATIGKAEAEGGTVSLRTRDSKDLSSLSIDDFVVKLKSEISSRVR